MLNKFITNNYKSICVFASVQKQYYYVVVAIRIGPTFIRQSFSLEEITIYSIL